jgi:hypothetical protein
MTDSCLKYADSLAEYTRDLSTRYMTRRISFFDREIGDALYSLGYVETITHQDGACVSIFSDGEEPPSPMPLPLSLPPASVTTSLTSHTPPHEDKYETLEMQLKHQAHPVMMSRQRNFSYNRRIRYGGSGGSNSQTPASPANHHQPPGHLHSNSSGKYAHHANNKIGRYRQSVLEPRRSYQPYD